MVSLTRWDTPRHTSTDGVTVKSIWKRLLWLWLLSSLVKSCFFSFLFHWLSPAAATDLVPYSTVPYYTLQNTCHSLWVLVWPHTVLKYILFIHIICITQKFFFLFLVYVHLRYRWLYNWKWMYTYYISEE